MGKYSKKKIIYLLLISVLAAVTLTGCLTRDERKKAKGYEKSAFWKTNAYLWDQYGCIGFVSNLSDITEADDWMGYFAENATPYVQGNVWLWGEKFNVIVNVETGECYDNRKAEAVREEIEAYLYDRLDIPSPESLEVYVNPKVISSLLDEDTNGYMLSGEVPDVEELFSDSEYEISVLLEYADSEMELDTIDVEELCEAGAEGPSVRLTFVNYHNSKACGNGVLTAGKCRKSSFMNAELLYYGKEVYSAYFERDDDDETDILTYSGTVSDTRRHYKEKTVNGIRFIWAEECYDVEIEETAAPRTFRTGKDESTLYAAEDTAVKVSCRRKQQLNTTNAVLCIEEEKPSGYETVFWEDAEEEEDGEIWTMRSMEGDISYHWISPRKDNAWVMLGVYQTK